MWHATLLPCRSFSQMGLVSKSVYNYKVVLNQQRIKWYTLNVKSVLTKISLKPTNRQIYIKNIKTYTIFVTYSVLLIPLCVKSNTFFLCFWRFSCCCLRKNYLDNKSTVDRSGWWWWMGLDNSCNLPIISFSRSAPLTGWRMVKVARELHIAKRSPRPLLLVAKA